MSTGKTIALIKSIGGGNLGGGSSLPEAAPYQQLVTGADGKWVADERLAWKELKKTELLANETLTFRAQNGIIRNAELISVMSTAGNNVEIEWDGTTYHCVTSAFNSVPVIGNMYQYLASDGENPEEFGLTDTGEPFIMMQLDDSSVGVFVFDATTESTVVTVAAQIFVYTPMDGNYLPIASTISPGAVKVYNFPTNNAPVSDMTKAVQDCRSGAARVFWFGDELIGAYINEETIDGTAKKVLYARIDKALLSFYRWVEDNGSFHESLREHANPHTDLYIFSGSGKRFRLVVDDTGALSAVES